MLEYTTLSKLLFILKNELFSLFFFRFIIIGIINTISSIGLFWSIIYFLGDSYYQYSYSLVLILFSIIGFLMHNRFLHDIKSVYLSNLSRFYIKEFFLWILSISILVIFHEILRVNLYISSVLIPIIRTLVNYLLTKYVIFIKKN